jgi:hypothetical protein
MHTVSRPGPRDWITGVLVGALLGLPLLGVGARFGMRVIALASRRQPFFTFEGSTTVMLLGAAAGAGVAGIFLLSRVAAPKQRAVRLALFTGLCAMLVLRGLRPVSLLTVSVFGPLFIAHAALLHAYWCRIHLRR